MSTVETTEGRPEPTQPVRITKRDLVRSWLLWTFFSHANYNYERLQASAFAHAMTPIIKRLYGRDPEETRAALKRHLVFFNTSPDVGGVIHGATIAMEEQRANGEPVTDNAINSTKTGLMGPMAGVGDTIGQGIVTPMLLALGIGITGLNIGSASEAENVSGSGGNVIGPLVYLVLISAYSLGIGYFSYTQGYYRGRSVVTTIFKSGLMDRVIVGASVLGNLVLGGLAATFIILFVGPSISLGEDKLSIQSDLLDKILPGLLPLSLVLMTWWLLKRGVHPIKLLVAFVAICLVAAIPFFGPSPKSIGDQCGSSLFQPNEPCPAPDEGGEGNGEGGSE